MSRLVHLTVNGVARTVPPDARTSLLEYLRQDLGLTGAKNGCDGTGTCGACTVLVNGQTRRSCQLKLVEVDGAEILTIEGLSEDGDHPIQRAFIGSGAVQCGFCTPGMILATKALLDRHPRPTREEILRGLSGNLCRCTGYAKIIEAVQRAAADTAGQAQLCTSVDIGSPLRRSDALAKVTGRAEYADDHTSSGTLILRTVWASEPHALIRGIDTSKAREIDGVVAVLTAEDIPGTNRYGLIHRNQPVLCGEKVLFSGDPVALVIAETAEAASEAAAKVDVDLAPLQPVFDSGEALAADAPRLHPEGNLLAEYRLQHGSPDTVMAVASTNVAGHFETPAVEHAYLEPEAGYAEWIDDTIVIHATAQYPQAIQRQLADVLGVEERRIRIVCPQAGGAFGGKTDISVHALLALGAWHTRRTVRLTWTREESLRASVKRHPMSMDYRIALDENGTLLGLEADIVANVGAYESLSHPVLEQTAAFSSGPYRVPHVDIRVAGVYTNTAISSAFRGFGIPQPAFAIESLLDDAAHRLGISPIEIRKRNALRPGDRSITGQTMGHDTHVLDVLGALEPSYETLRATLPDSEGIGIACGYKNVGLGLGEEDHATATLSIEPTGRLSVHVGAVEVGQGSETVLGQIAADELGAVPEAVEVRWGDTALTPDGRETNASRQTVVSGNAVLLACESLKTELLAHASKLAPELEGSIHFDRGLVDESGQRVPWEELLSRLDSPVSTSARYQAPDTSPLTSWEETIDSPANYFAYTFFANLAHVRADRDSGRIAVQRMVSAYDVGRVINRQTAEGQIEGGAIMGVGYALSESYTGHGEQPTTTPARCGVPRILGTPSLETIFVEPGDSVGPHGAKGIGEVAMISVAPAITNAIRDALGIRVNQLPATPAMIRSLLAEDQGRNT